MKLLFKPSWHASRRALTLTVAGVALHGAQKPSSAQPVTTAPATPPLAEIARPADAWVETIGIGSRFDWMLSENKLDIIRRGLRDSKIRYVRTSALAEGVDSARFATEMRKVTLDLGIKVCLLVQWHERGESQRGIARWTQAPSPVYALEGVNESFGRPNWGDKGWNTALDVQKFVWQEGRARGLKVYSWTLGGPAGFYWSMPREADQYTTHANVHPYHWYANPHGRGNTKINGLWQNTETPENQGLVMTARDIWMQNMEKPLVSTEFGWGVDTLPGNYTAVSEEVQAKYLTRALFENFNAGMERGYIYSLFPHNDDFGIANRDGTQRPSGRAIAALITLIEERGATAFTPGTLRYALKTDSGMKTVDDRELRNDEIHHTLLQKKDGRFVLALWADKDSQEGDNAPEAATLTLPDGASRVRVFSPLTNGTAPVATLPAVAPGGAVRLQGVVAIPDHPLLVEITPLAAPRRVG